MKHILIKKSAFILFVFAISILSCKKTTHVYPTIKFATGSNLISHDTTLTSGSTIKIGVISNQYGTDKVNALKQYVFSKWVNGGTEQTIQSIDMGADGAPSYSPIETIKIDGNSGDEWVYKFKVNTSVDLESASCSLTIKVK